MATRAEQKAKAREERLAREREAAEAARRRQRLYTIGGVVVVAIIVVAVIIAIASGGGSSSGGGGKAASTVDKLLAGIPQSGATLGKASAPVTVTLFEDLECPVCKEFNLGAGNQVIKNEVRAGKVKLVFKSLQTATPDLATFQFQQQAAVAAGRQNKLWHFTENFYHEQGPEGTPYVTEAYLDKLAKQIPGLNYQQWLQARKAANLAGPVNADLAEARTKGFNSTPTIVVQGPKSSPSPVSGAIDYGQLQSLIKKAGGFA